MNSEATKQELDADSPSAAGQPAKLDKPAIVARVVLIFAGVLLIAAAVFSALSGAGWFSRLLANGWLLTLVLILLAAAGLFLHSISSAKNIAWRQLARQFGQPFGENIDRKNFSTGRGLVDNHAYLGLRCFGAPSGLEVGRIVSFVNPPLYIPWSAINKIDTFPSLLTGRKEFETDMQAQITLREQPELKVELPWLSEYRQLLPKSVKYRAIKLTKK